METIKYKHWLIYDGLPQQQCAKFFRFVLIEIGKLLRKLSCKNHWHHLNLYIYPLSGRHKKIICSNIQRDISSRLV